MLLFCNKEISLEELQEMLIAEREHTFCDCGDLILEFQDSKSKFLQSQMLIASHEVYGYYMHYHDFGAALDKLSLWDRKRLGEVIDYDTDCLVSVGLFVPVENALPAIMYFAKTGDIGSIISWIEPVEMPQSGNWA